jgi:hypothetical protein
MTFAKAVLTTVTVVLFMGATAAQADAQSENRQFSAIVAKIVAGYDNPNLEGMSSKERRDWNACVVSVFAGVPQGRKRFVLAGGSRSEQQNRLEQVSLENRAAVRQQITRDCPI